MPTKLLQRSLQFIFQQQTNILSAAFVIMGTVVLSQILGLVRQRLLVSIFGASDQLGVYLAASRIPDFLFQLIVAGALTSSFIPVFSEYLAKGQKEEGHRVASSLLYLGLLAFSAIGFFLFIFAEFFSSLIAPGFSEEGRELMANITRIIIFGEIIFIVASFLSSVLQSYNRFFVPGIAAALYNLGIIASVFFLSERIGIYSAPVGVVIGAFIFLIAQIPLVKGVEFSFKPTLIIDKGVREVLRLMWPRTVSLAIFQLGTLLIVTLVSFISSGGRSYVIFDYAQTLAFAPVALFGQTIAQAAFPVLSRERERIEAFRVTFLTSFNQLLYLVLPLSVLFLVLRIPIVRLIYGAAQFDWEATVLTGRTLAFFSLSIFAQALSYLVSRSFYALHDTKTPLIVGALTTALMLLMSAFFVFGLGTSLDPLAQELAIPFRFIPSGVETIAFSFSVASILNLFVLLYFLARRMGGFPKQIFLIPIIKIFIGAFFMGVALYIPLKLLDQLVFDTTRTVNLILLTGISSLIGFSIYFFFTWLLNVKEASMFFSLAKKLGNWKDILARSEEFLGPRPNPH